MFEDLNLEISLFPLDVNNLRKCQEFNIEVPADLDQFGRNNSHGAVIGGKGLIQL
jgi:hypothetical protein